LAKAPTTPAISSTTPHAISARRTPGTGRTPGSGRTPGTGRTYRNPLENVPTGRRTAPTTPHAIRAQQQERARNAIPLSARKRLVVRRETPRGMMRELSKLLAKTSKAAEESPQVDESQLRRRIRGLDDDSDDEIPRDVPRLSIPFNEDDDSFHEAPRFSMDMRMDEDEQTMHSVELGRDRLSRGSYGRLSEVNDLTALGLDVSNVLDETIALGGDGEFTFRAPLEEVTRELDLEYDVQPLVK